MRVLQKEEKDDGTVYTIKLGFTELEMLYGLCHEAYTRMPKQVLELGPARNRMNNMKKHLGREVMDYRKEHGGGYKPGRYFSPRSK